jgi:hypothetical protein
MQRRLALLRIGCELAGLLDLRGARNAALRALALELPAPVIADALQLPGHRQNRRNARTTFIDYITRRLAPPDYPFA